MPIQSVPAIFFLSTGSLRQTANGRADYTITNVSNNSKKSKAVLSFSDFSLRKNVALKPALIRMSRFCLMMLNLIIVKTAVPKESLSKILGSCDPPFSFNLLCKVFLYILPHCHWVHCCFVMFKPFSAFSIDV